MPAAPSLKNLSKLSKAKQAKPVTSQLDAKRKEVIDLVLKMSETEIDRVRALAREISKIKISRRPKSEIFEIIVPQWPRDKWYACHYCGVRQHGKYNLSRHHFAKHR